MHFKVGCIPTRFIILFMVCVYMFCVFASFNATGSLQHDIMNVYHLDTYKFSLFFSMVTWPSILDMVHGYLIDRYFGLRMGTVIYTIILLVGGCLYILAGFLNQFWFLLLSRFIQGVGANPLILCCNGYIIHWFKEGKEVNLAYSLHESVIWLGTSVIYFCSENILALLRRKYNEFYSLAFALGSETVVLLVLRVIATITLVVLTPSKKPTNSEKVSDTKTESSDTKPKNWKDYLSFTPLFWLFAFTCFMFFFTALNFIGLSQMFFRNKYHITIDEANDLSALLTLIVFIAAPIVGVLLDYIGQNLTFLTGALILSTTSFLFLTYGNQYSPYIPVVLLGISISMSSSCWSLFANIVKEHQVMVAYGIAQTGMCTTSAFGSLVSGFVVDKFGYHGLAINLLIVSVCGLVKISLVIFLNYRNGNPLNKWRLTIKSEKATQSQRRYSWANTINSN